MQEPLNHFDESGASRMVDVGQKAITDRVAAASAVVTMQPETLTRIKNGKESDKPLAKGDVLEVARLAGIMAAKQTGNVIPLCHPLPLDGVTVDFSFTSDSTIEIRTEVRVQAKTGVEMEAMVAATIVALTIYDMCKSIDRSMKIGDVQLDSKSGGKSGDYRRKAT